MVLGGFMKWKQTGNKLETHWKQTGINWKQKNVSTCFLLFPVCVSSKNALIMRVLQLCFQCFHFFKETFNKLNISKCRGLFSSTSRNFKNLIKLDFKKKLLKTKFKALFLYLIGDSIDKQQIS